MILTKNSTDRLLWDPRGTIMVEYTILLCLVTVGCAVAMIGLGVPLVQMFMVQQVWLSLGVP